MMICKTIPIVILFTFASSNGEIASPSDSANLSSIKSRFARHILNGVELRLSAYEVLIFLLSKYYHIKLLEFIFNTHMKFRPLCFSKKSPNGVTYYEGIIPDLFGLMAEIFNLTYNYNTYSLYNF